LRPLVQQMRDFFSEAVALGGKTQSDFEQRIGPIERRLDEIVITEPRLKELIDALFQCSKKAFALAPPGGPWMSVLNRPPTPKEIDESRRMGQVAEEARNCEQKAMAALRRMSDLRGKAQQ